MHPPPSRHVSWANLVVNNTSDNDSMKHNNPARRLTKLPPTTTTTTTTMPKRLLPKKQSDQKSASNKPSKLLAHPASNNKCSKPTIMSNKHNNKCCSSSFEGKNHRRHLLVGYLAHEFLTKGTIMGRRWDQVPSQRVEPNHEEKKQKYVEIAHLLKTADGSKMDGIVNPTQLAYSLKLLQ